MRWILLGLATILCGCINARGELEFGPRADGPYGLERNVPELLPADKVVELISKAKAPAAVDKDARRDMRNEYIGRAIYESDRLCEEYLQGLNKIDRDGNLFLGGLSTLLGGLGAAFTQAAVVRPLSAGAGIASGWRGDFNTSTFVNQSAGVIQKAIDARRKRERAVLLAKLDLPNEVYPYSVALADVESYHSECSLHAAFAELGDAIDRSQVNAPVEINKRLQNLAEQQRWINYVNKLRADSSQLPTNTDTGPDNGPTVPH